MKTWKNLKGIKRASEILKEKKVFNKWWPNENSGYEKRDWVKEEEILEALRKENQWSWPEMQVSSHTDANRNIGVTAQGTVNALYDLAIKFRDAAMNAKSEGNLLGFEKNMEEYQKLMDQIRSDDLLF